MFSLSENLYIFRKVAKTENFYFRKDLRPQVDEV